MAGIFTRPELSKIIGDENLTPDERVDRIMALRGRDLDEGYVTRSAAKAAQDSAIEQAKAEWEKNIPKPNAKESEEYKALESEFAGYKAMQEAKGSDDYKDVKGKFFDTVYGMVDRGEGAKPVPEQLAEIRKNYEEYFNPPAAEGEKPKNLPQYSQQPGHTGTNPESREDEIYRTLSANW